jgi:hypothetical protein
MHHLVSLPNTTYMVPCHPPPAAKNMSVRAEWLHQSGRAPSEPSETPQGRITPRQASIARVALHIALRTMFRHFFSLCRSPNLNKHSGVVANCDHTGECIHWVHGGIRMSHCENLSSCSFYFKLEESRKVKRYDATGPWRSAQLRGSTKSRKEGVKPKVRKDRLCIFVL